MTMKLTTGIHVLCALSVINAFSALSTSSMSLYMGKKIETIANNVDYENKEQLSKVLKDNEIMNGVIIALCVFVLMSWFMIYAQVKFMYHIFVANMIVGAIVFIMYNIMVANISPLIVTAYLFEQANQATPEASMVPM